MNSRSIVTNTYNNPNFSHPNFSKQTCARALAEIIRKPYEFNDFVKIHRFHFTARCTRDTPVMRPGHESLATTITRAACAHRRALMISLTDILMFCARGLPHRPRPHHRDHLPHRQMDISIVNVVAIIGAVISAPSSSLSSPPLLPSSLTSQPLPTSSCYRPRPSIVIMLISTADSLTSSLVSWAPSSVPLSVVPPPSAS